MTDASKTAAAARDSLRVARCARRVDGVAMAVRCHAVYVLDAMDAAGWDATEQDAVWRDFTPDDARYLLVPGAPLCVWTTDAECAMARERSVVGANDTVPPCAYGEHA